MSKRANPTLIGAFVVLGFALGFAAIMVITSSRLFSHSSEYVLYFDASLTGLDPGAPVKFRGVTIGSVREVLVHQNQAPTDSSLPVVIEIKSDLMKRRSDAALDLLNSAEMERHIRRGLRGKLEMQSLLTGLLFVQLDFLPDTAAKFRQTKIAYPEIPTVPVEMGILQVDFAQIAQRLGTILAKLDESLSEIRMRDLNRQLTNLLASLNTIANSAEITNTVASARMTLDEARRLSVTLRERIEKLSQSADQTLSESSATLNEFRATAQSIHDWIAPDAPLRSELDSTLRDLADAAKSISSLAEFLQRHPNALISGRETPREKP